MEGILNINKPAGLSSARVVAQVKQLTGRQVKVGHAGTLDPFATGVLLVLVGAATKRCESLMSAPKQYEATIKLGFRTATDDPESPEMPAHAAVEVDRPIVEQALASFVGDIRQRPPAYSAIKIGGRNAYELARKGKIVELQERTVQVYGIEILWYRWPLLAVRIDCGRGTYIRAIARDLGEALGVGGYLTQLCRTRVGEFRIESAITVDQLGRDGIAKYL